MPSSCSWWCHFDDDDYVHVRRLAQLLRRHDPRTPVYLGKPSTSNAIEIPRQLNNKYDLNSDAKVRKPPSLRSRLNPCMSARECVVHSTMTGTEYPGQIGSDFALPPLSIGKRLI